MNKREAIRIVNDNNNKTLLQSNNTHWSNIVEYSSQTGWWLNVPFHKFEKDLHFLLNEENLKRFTHIFIPSNSVRNPTSTFRNKQGAADIFMPDTGINKLVDMQSTSSRHNFNLYEKKTFKY